MGFVLVLIFFVSLNDFCVGCNVGYYGESCSKECPKFCHDRECNVTTGKCLSCVGGYYSDINKECIPCPENCTVCSSEKYCFACKSGFRGDVCDDVCTNCKPYTSCDKHTGYCFENCSEGLSGELCNIPCDSKCKSCDRHNKDECILCADGYGAEKTCNQTGRVCNIRCKALTEMQPDRQGSSTTDIGLIVGLVIGFIIVAMCVCMLVFITVRRRSSNRRSFWCMSGDRNKTPATNDEENVGLMEEKKTTETREFTPVEKITILQKFGTFSAIEKKYDDMKINVAGNKVTVEGYQLDIEDAFKEIDNKCGDIEQVKYTHSKSREWLSFYQKEQTIEYVNKKLEQKQLHGICDITGTELNVFVDGKGNSENFKSALLESISEIPVPVVKSLSSEWGGEFVIDIRRTFQEKIDIFTHEQQDMVIICTDDVVKQVTTMVNGFLDGIEDTIEPEPGVFEFVSNFWTKYDFDEIRKCGVMVKTEANRFKLRGLLENVVEGKVKLNMKLHHICSKQHVLKGTGMVTILEAAVHSGTISDIEKKCRCVIKLPPEIDSSLSAMLCDYGVIDSQAQEEKQQDSRTNASPICFQTRRHKIKIQLIQGDISHQTADIIVVGAASNLDLQSGSAFSALLKQGSPNLLTGYNRRYPNGIQNGEVAIVDSAALNKIYLTSLPPWKEARCNGGKVLRNFMRECLRLADKFDKNSIAFSIKVAWENLGYPRDIVVSIIFGVVVEFDSSYSNTSLIEVKIVLDIKDDETIKIYERLLKTQGRENRTKRMFIEDGTILTKNSEYRMVKDGCAIGPIQLQVQIGDLINCTADAIVTEVGTNAGMKDDLDQAMVKEYLNTLSENQQQETVVLNDGFVITDSAGLKAKLVIHVLFEDTMACWRRKLVYCLKEAGKKYIKSVALPLVGSAVGSKAFSPDGIGACLFAAIDDFTSLNSKSSVTEVKLVVHESDAGCVPAIIAALQDRTTALNSQWGIGKLFKSQLGLVAESNNFRESSITVHSDSAINLDRCIEALDDRTRLEFAKKVFDVDMDVVSSLKDKQINRILKSDIMVDVTFDKQAGQFTIYGPLRNVLAAVTCLHNKMLQYKRNENSPKSADVLYKQTRWHWLSGNRMKSVKEVPYDMMTNFYIETAYRAGKQTVEFQSKEGKIYVTDFQKLVEYPKVNMCDTVMVIRKDVLNPGKFKEFQVDVKNLFSKSWAAMKTNENVIRVALDDGKEYQKVEQRFLGKTKNGRGSSKDNSRSVQVVKIERIQNKTLYKQFKTKKYAMKQQKSGCKQTELRLWHECTEERICWIINNGFNRSYCGVHEVSYGQGVYFAADASYSAQRYLAENKPEAKGYMFLAKVLTGELIKGDPSMRGLPLVDPARPNVMYDSAVDDVHDPTQFVIFHDKQAYPKYLITYTS